MSTETTTLEQIKTAPPKDRAPLLHIYCIACLDAHSPEKILPACGQGSPANNDMMLYPRLEDAPPRDVCVVCLEIDPCPRCGT